MASRLEQKYRYIWEYEGVWYGTNDKDTASHFDDEYEVIDVVKGEAFGSGESLVEAEMPDEDEEE